MDRQTKQYLRQSSADNKLLLQNQQNSPTKFSRILPTSGYLSKINNQLLDYSIIDNDFLLKNQNISLESNPSNIPLKISTADQKLLKTYVDNLPKNYQFQAEDGSIKYRKYQSPNDVPNLEEVSPDMIDLLATRKMLENERDDKLRVYNNNYDICLDNIQKLNQDFKQLELMLKNDKINYEEYKKSDARIKKDLTKNQKGLIKISNSASKLNSEFNIKLADYDAVVKEEADIKARNLQKANAYQDIFNVYNQGAMSTQKENFETEQEYLDRLQQFSEQLVPENELENAKQYVSKLFRQRMKDLILPDVIIEQVANSVDPVSSDSVNNKQRLLNNWAYIKSKFLSTYGFNPKMTADEIVDFFNFISSLGISKGVRQPQPQPVRQSEPEPIRQSQPEPIRQSEPEPIRQSEPVIESQHEPVIESQHEPVIEPISQSARSRSRSRSRSFINRSNEEDTGYNIFRDVEGENLQEEDLPRTVVPRFSRVLRELETTYTPKYTSQNIADTYEPENPISNEIVTKNTPLDVLIQNVPVVPTKTKNKPTTKVNEVRGGISDDSYVLSRPDSSEYVMFSWAINNRDDPEVRYYIKDYGVFKMTSFNQGQQRMSSNEHISRYLGLNDKEGKHLGRLLGGTKGIATKPQMLDFLMSSCGLNAATYGPEVRIQLAPTYEEFNRLYIKEPVDKMIGSSSKEGSGIGVSANDFPKYVHFGSVLLELRKLHHHNELVIKDHRKCAIYGFPTIKVSDNFSNIIINMVHKNEPSFSDLSRLNSHEKELYDVLIALAGLKKRIYNTHDNTISTLKNRLNLLEGEIEIGNNNPKIYNEIRKILFKLHHLKVISMKQVQGHLKQIG